MSYNTPIRLPYLGDTSDTNGLQIPICVPVIGDPHQFLQDSTDLKATFRIKTIDQDVIISPIEFRASFDGIKPSELISSLGIPTDQAIEIEQELLDFIHHDSNERGIKIDEDMEKALANLLLIVGQKLMNE